MTKKAPKTADPPQARDRRLARTQDAHKKRDDPSKGRSNSVDRKHKRRSDSLRMKQTPASESSRSSSQSRIPHCRQLRCVASPTDVENSRQTHATLSKSARPPVAPRRTSEHTLSPRLGLLRPRSPTSSIFSCQTSQTTTSTSSNRTVTQESYSRSTNSNPTVDVFEFLEQKPPTGRSTIYEDDEGWDSEGSSSSGSSCNGSCCASLPELDHDTQSIRSSSLWDSGMSASGDSPEPVRKRPKAIVGEVAHIPVRRSDDSLPGEEGSAPDIPEDVKTPIPGAFPSLLLPNTDAPPPAPSPPPAYQPHTRMRRVMRDDQSQTSLQGYELLAHELIYAESSAPQPMYRRFGHLQHRSLLHLQDIIAEMEAELRMLDESISQLTTDGTDGHHPQSRRLDRIHNIGARRHQVLDCLTHHLTQYNQLLASQTTSAHVAPSPAQITEYKSWLYKHQPIPANEASFLHHESDLLLLKPRHSVLGCSISSAHSTALWSSLVIGLVGTCMLLYLFPQS